MSRIRENNISNMFAASLSFNVEEKVANYSLAKEDMVVEKYAGIDIYQPTVENVEDFVRKYMMNETAFFPKALEIHTFLSPSAFDSANQDYVSEATGVVKIRLHDANLEFPFYITDGELVPFDIIQLNGQRIPYSRENLRRVLFGIDKTFADKINGAKGSVSGEFSPYIKVEKSVNPATSSGFLGNVLQIQDQTVRGNGSNFVIASEKLDSGMEKLSSMKMLTMKEVTALENEFKKQAHEEFKGELEKFAKEIEQYDDTAALKLFTNLDNVQFENAGSLPNGTCISFPEKKNKEMCMTKGIVIDNYMSIAGKKAKAKKIVVAEDGRMAILESGDKFLCFKSNQKFTLPNKSLSSVSEGDIILAFNGDSALVPSVVENIAERGLSESKVTGDIKFKILSMSAVDSITTLLELMNDSSSIGMSGGMSFGSSSQELHHYKIAPMQDVKFNEIQYKEYIKKLSENTRISELLLAPILREYSIANDSSKGKVVFCTDYDTTKIIPINGILSDYLKDKSELRKLVETNGEFSMPKTAGEGEKIYIKCIDPSRGVYYVQIKYVDKSKTVFNQMTKEYRDVPEAGVKQILRVLSFDGGQSAEMLHRATEMGSVNMPLPTTARVDVLTGANVINRSTQQVKNVMGKLVSPQAVGDAVLTSALGALMTGAITSRGLVGQPGVKDKAREALALASKFASESEALSVAFEKCAQEHQSTSMLKVAKAMAESALLHNKVIEVINGSCYPRIIEAAYDIACGKNELEKIASDLIDLKFTQYKNKDHIINPNYIQGAVRQLDNMYKLACELCNKDEKFAEKLATTMSEIPGTPNWEEDEEKKECPKCHHNPCICKGKDTEKRAESVDEELGVVKDTTEGLGAKQFADHLKSQGKDPKVNYSKEKGWTVTAETDTDIHTQQADDNDTAVGLEPNNTETMALEQELERVQEEADLREDKENEALKSSIDSDTHYVMASEELDRLVMEKQAGIAQVGDALKTVGKVSGATYGAIGGAALGAGAGALGAQDGHRAEGALKGGALGAVAGGVGGAVGGKALAQKGQELYTTGAKHGFMGGAVAGAGLGAAATHVAENGGMEAVKDAAGNVVNKAKDVASKVKDTAQNVASKVKGEGKTVAENTAEQNGANQWQEAQKELQSQPAPQPNVQQAQPQAVQQQQVAQPNVQPQQQVVQGQSVAQQQILDANGQPLVQGQPQQVPVQQPVAQAQAQAQGTINPNQPPAPRPEPSQATSTSPANTVDTNGQPVQQLDANGQPIQGQPQQDGKQHWFSGVANWWNNLGNIPTNQAANEVKGLNYPGLNPNQPIFKDVTAFELLDNLYMEKVAAMNVPNEEEKQKESNGENLAEITCEVCGYKGQPDEYGKCPTCGAQGGITPVDPTSKVEQTDDYYDWDRHTIDQDQIAQGETEIMDYV